MGGSRIWLHLLVRLGVVMIDPSHEILAAVGFRVGLCLCIIAVSLVAVQYWLGHPQRRRELLSRA